MTFVKWAMNFLFDIPLVSRNNFLKTRRNPLNGTMEDASVQPSLYAFRIKKLTFSDGEEIISVISEFRNVIFDFNALLKFSCKYIGLIHEQNLYVAFRLCCLSD